MQQQLRDLDKRQAARHLRLDLALLSVLVLIVAKFGDWRGLVDGAAAFLRAFPDHYTPVFDFVHGRMDPYLAICLFTADIYFLLKTYYIERVTVLNAHKKYSAHRTTAFVAIHGIGSTLEFTLGLLAVLRPDSKLLAYCTALLAFFVNIPTGFMLSPGVFGEERSGSNSITNLQEYKSSQENKVI